MSKDYISPLSLAGIRRNPSVIPVVGCIVLGCSLGTAYTLRLALMNPDEAWIFKKSRPEKDYEKKEYKTENKENTEKAKATELKLLEYVMSQERKQIQLENQLASLRERLEDFKQQPSPQQKTGTGNIFELSEVMQAHNMALEARFKTNLEEQRKLMIREHLLKVEGEILKVENKYRPTINKIKELDAHLENQRQIQQREAPARLLWISCQQLLNRMTDAPQKPLEKDPAYEVLSQFAANDNQLAISVLNSIPPKVLKEGVQSEETLADRFSRLEKVCKRVALVDSHGAGLGRYILSYLQSLFIIDKGVPVSDDEVEGKTLVDPTAWTTFDILARVRYCLSRRNLEQAIRYANQLKGQPRVVARDWIRDARLHLLTRQALGALMTHAEAIALDTTQSSIYLTRFEQ